MNSIQDQEHSCLGMLPQHREKILKNIERLIDETNYTELAKACLDDRLINKAMLSKIEAISSSNNLDTDSFERERHRRLFKKLINRGPEAFSRLKNILSRCGRIAALRRLDEDHIADLGYNSLRSGTPAYVSRIEQNEGNLILQIYDKEINPQNPHIVIKSTVIHKNDTIPAYSMKSQHDRGVLFMVNIIDFVNEKDHRRGAKKDSESMLYLFKELGFKLYAYENLKFEDFFRLLDEVIHSEDVRKTECFVMALMTHGEMNEHNRVEKVQLSDGSVIFVDDILKKFNNNVCTNLINKPKIFLFPFCRGTKSDNGHGIKTQTDIIRRVSQCPVVSDILICYATLPGYRSHRDPESGSWYIQSFCEMMAKYIHNKHFEDVLKMIQGEVGQYCSEEGDMQTANYINMGFNKLLYFNPGVFERVEQSG